jgi:hypothetical protein
MYIHITSVDNVSCRSYTIRQFFMQRFSGKRSVVNEFCEIVGAYRPVISPNMKVKVMP